MLKQEGYDLIGAAFEVYTVLGFGLYEEIYQESLEHELSLRNIPFESKPLLTTFYKELELQKKYYPDLIVFGEIIVELKAVSSLAEEHEAQLFNYMNITRKSVGYLINFGSKEKLEWKPIILTELH